MPTVYYPQPVQELLLSLASGGLPHESVARVHKDEEGTVLGTFYECETQRDG